MEIPDLNGEQILAAMRKIQPTVRVILSSGHDEQDLENCLREKGLAGFIRKPYQLNDLVTELKKTLVVHGA